MLHQSWATLEQISAISNTDFTMTIFFTVYLAISALFIHLLNHPCSKRRGIIVTPCLWVFVDCVNVNWLREKRQLGHCPVNSNDDHNFQITYYKLYSRFSMVQICLVFVVFLYWKNIFPLHYQKKYEAYRRQYMYIYIQTYKIFQTWTHFIVFWQNGLVPIVEPEVLCDGEHDLITAQRVTEQVTINLCIVI